MGILGVVEEPASARQELLARLDRPDTVEALNGLLDRLDVMVLVADAANEFLKRSEVIADSISDSLGELRQIPMPPDVRQLLGKLPQLTTAGLQAAELSGNPALRRLLSSGLLERLGDPNTIASLHELLNRLDLASFILSSVNEFLERSEVIADSVAESIHEVTKAAPTLDLAKIKDALAALPSLLEVALEIKRSGLLAHTKTFIETLNGLQASGTLAPDTVAVVGGLGVAATSTHKKQEFARYAPKGLFGLMGALKDPNVQATLGFAIAFAHNYGQTLRAEASSPNA